MSREFQREYVVRLPLPLAQLYHRAYNDKSAQGRHNNTFYLFEALVKLATAPAVAAYLEEIEHGAPRVAALDRLLAQLAMPSLGQWVGMLRELARHFGTRPDAAAHPLGHLWDQLNCPHRDRPALLGLYCRIKHGPDGEPAGDQSCSLIQLLDALVQYRNAVFGHGAGRAETFYEREMGPLLFPAANEVLAEGMLDLLGPPGSRLVHLAELRMLDEDRVEVGLRELVGDRSVRAAPLILGRSEAAALVPDRVAVLRPGRPVPLRLDPLLVYRERAEGDEVLFLNRDRNGRQVEYLSYTRGEPERDRGTAPALAALLSRVTGRAVGEAQLEALAQQSLAETPSVEALFGPAETAARVLGDYEILAEVGRGGMGVVYLARQRSLGRLVALKMLPADLAGDEVALARFRREMRVLARCDHPNIVKILASGTLPDGRVYYTMEYVPGCDLEQVWRELASPDHRGEASTLGGSTWTRAVLAASRKKREQAIIRPVLDPDGASPGAAAADPTAPALPLPPLLEPAPAPDDPGGDARQVALLIRDVASALQAVHDQQVIHRDVKPANLMLSPDAARVVLMDFGLAKAQSLSMTRGGPGGLLGTLRYAAPEQLAAANLRVGPAADVRGLGVTLWELLTRRRLFAEAEDERQLAVMVHDEDVPRLRMIDPGLDRDLEAIVARATERRVADRIATGGQLAGYLQLYLDGKPLPIRPPTAAEMARRWVGQHKAVVFSAVAAAAVILATAIIAFLLVAHSRNEQAALATKNAELADRERGEKEELEHQKELLTWANVEVTRQRDETRRNLYLAVQQLAQRAWQENRLGLLRGLLARQEPGRGEGDYRGFEWHFLKRLSEPERLVFKGHDQTILSVAFSPDGRTAASAGFGGEIKLWEVPTGQLLRTLEGHRAAVCCLRFSPDGRRLASAGNFGSLKIWDYRTGDRLFDLQGHGSQVFGAAFSPDGSTLASAGADQTVRLWDVASGRALATLQGHQAMVWCVAFSPDGSTLASGGQDRVAILWDVAGRKRQRTLEGHSGLITQIAFSPDGERLACSCREDLATLSPSRGRQGEVRIWDLKQFEVAATLMTGSDGVFGVNFSPDGLHIAAAQGREVTLWHTGTSERLLTHRGHEDLVRCVAMSADGRYLVSGDELGAVRLWDAFVRAEAARFAWLESADAAVAHDPSGATLAVAFNNDVRLYDSVDGRLLQGLRPPIPDAKAGAVSGRERPSVAFRPDGRQLAAARHRAGWPGAVALWDPAVGRLDRIVETRHAELTGVAYSARGERLLTLGQDGTLAVWDPRSGAELASVSGGHHDPALALAVDPTGRYYATGGGREAEMNQFGKSKTEDEGEFAVWEAATNRVVLFKPRQPAPILALAFTPGGERLITADAQGRLTAWDPRSGKPWWQSAKNSSGLSSLVVSPDGRRILTGGSDGSVRVWDASAGQELGVWPIGRVSVSSLSIHPGGRSLFCGASLGWARHARGLGREAGVFLLDADQSEGPRELHARLARDITWHQQELGRAVVFDNRYACLYHARAIRDSAPRDDALALESAKALYVLRDWAHAEGEYRRAIGLRPGSAEAHFFLGDALVHLGRRDGGIAMIRKATELDPDNADYLYDLGNRLRDAGDLDGAIDCFRRTLRIREDYAEAHCNLGQVLRRTGRFAEAVDHLRRGHELGSKRPDWEYPSAQWVGQAERLLSLDRKLEPVLAGREKPANAVERLQFAEICQCRGLVVRAVAFVEEAFREDPKLAGRARRLVAGAAARAAAGVGDAGALDQATRGRYLRKAVAWLRVEVKEMQEYLNSISEEQRSRTGIPEMLDQWWGDTDFKILSDDRALGKFSEDDRNEVTTLRNEVDAVRRAAAPSPRPGASASGRIIEGSRDP